MRDNSISKQHLTVYLKLLLFVLIAYLPLSSFLFALKNDALTTNFPNKYFFSASLHQGFLPIWNPYINFGIPLYADPGFAFWNPITWIFGALGYSVPMLSAEIIFYIWIGGIAMYRLGIWLGHSIPVSFCMGMMYMCCGLFIGNLQHINFLTAAAFLPWVVKTYLDLQKSFSGPKLFYCLVSLYLFAAGGHPAIPLAGIYFLVFIQLGLILFDNNREERMKDFLRSLKTSLILCVCFLFLTAPLLYSYYEIYPRFTRGGPVGQSLLLNTGFDLRSYISFLFPFSNTGHDDFFTNDVLMRNGYFSVAGLACFLIAIFKKKNNYQKLFMLSGIMMLLLSIGGQLKKIIYDSLPLLNHVRINGEFRVFGILSFIIVGSYILQKLFEGSYQKEFKLLLCVTALLSFIIVLGCYRYGSGNLFFFRHYIQKGDFFRAVKSWLDELRFYDRLFINAAFLFLLTGLYFLVYGRFKNSLLLPLFIASDLIICSWLNLPVTGVQLKGPFNIQTYFDQVPTGIPVPDLKPIGENKYKGEDVRNLIGDWSYYSKQPGAPERCNYPTILNHTAEYFSSSLPDTINTKPVFFILNPLRLKELVIDSYSPAEINVRVEVSEPDSLVFLQNDYFRWKVIIDGKPGQIRRSAIAFMQIPLTKGVNRVRFVYDSKIIQFITIASLLCWMTFIFFVLMWKRNRQKISNRHII